MSAFDLDFSLYSLLLGLLMLISLYPLYGALSVAGL
jgi:hypothetical protein